MHPSRWKEEHVSDAPPRPPSCLAQHSPPGGPSPIRCNPSQTLPLRLGLTCHTIVFESCLAPPFNLRCWMKPLWMKPHFTQLSHRFMLSFHI